MPENRFQVFSVESAQVIELELPEMLDSEEFDQLNDSILTLVDKSTDGRWIIDLTHVSYMGSSMLGLMVNLRQRIKAASGRLVLCSMPPSLLQIFRTCCMERLFVIAKTRADALKLAR